MQKICKVVGWQSLARKQENAMIVVTETSASQFTAVEVQKDGRKMRNISVGKYLNH